MIACISKSKMEATWKARYLATAEYNCDKDKFREKQRQPEFGGNGLGFFGPGPQGYSLEVDEMIRNQVALVWVVNISNKINMT